mgnify:FL=1
MYYFYTISFHMPMLDNSLFMQYKSHVTMFIILSIDDLVIGAKHLIVVKKVKYMLATKLQMEDL